MTTEPLATGTQHETAHSTADAALPEATLAPSAETQTPDGNASADANSDADDSDEPQHPIAVAIDRLVHRSRDIKLAMRQFMPMALEMRKKSFEGIRADLDANVPLLEDDNPQKQVLAQKKLHDAMLRFERMEKSRVPDVIESGLFLALFSAFDAFTGDLLRGLYERKPILFNSLNKSLTFSEILEAPSIEQLKLQVLDDEIETFRRKSYVEQFATMSNRFDIKLTGFTRWPEFVERSQRRNLITHCDGLVTEQYIKVCESAGITLSTLPALGSRVTLGPKYLFASCELAIEVGIKLGQTLWRKTLPQELKEADKHLLGTLFEALEVRMWPRARMIGEFAFGLRELASDLDRKIVTINYAQALKRDGAADQAAKIVRDVDWTAATNDFKLATAVLLENYDDASALMKKIGKDGELLTDQADYHTWPLFIEFRETEQFSRAYQEIFGHPYADKLKEDASATSKAAEEATREQDTEATTLSTEAPQPSSNQSADRAPNQETPSPHVSGETSDADATR